MVDQSSEVEFYNDIYRRDPQKWGRAIERDVVAFGLVSQEIEEPESMLDYGCGNGHTLAFFKEKWPDTKMAGVDISDVALELAKERVPDGKFSQTIKGMWDVITIMGVAEHFIDPLQKLHGIGHYHLSDGGIIYLEVPNCLAYSDDKTEGFRKTYKGADQMEWHWKRSTWEDEIKRAGLKISKRYWGLVPAWGFIWILTQ